MKLQPADVVRAAASHPSRVACLRCKTFASAGWESFPGGASERMLRHVGSLWLADEPEPTLREFHPAATNYWSPDAPIALAFYPYNRCELWRCVACGRPFLRHTEYGGYYADRRIRELQRQLIIASPDPEAS